MGTFPHGDHSSMWGVNIHLHGGRRRSTISIQVRSDIILKHFDGEGASVFSGHLFLVIFFPIGRRRFLQIFT